jgi:hypothetical protein
MKTILCAFLVGLLCATAVFSQGLTPNLGVSPSDSSSAWATKFFCYSYFGQRIDTATWFPTWTSILAQHYLVPADSTKIRNQSSSLYLKNADSTTLKNALLKNADSTAIRNQSNALYLKNADSTTQRTYSNATYAPKASPTFTGRSTIPAFVMALRAVASGDSVFGTTFIRNTDSTMISWNGTGWTTIKKIAP